MSMEHTRATMLRLRPHVGDVFRSNKRRPILTLTEDSCGGVHDMLLAACDNERYGLLGCTEYHDDCTDNLHAAMAELGLRAPETPSPLNLLIEHRLDRRRGAVLRSADDAARRLCRAACGA